MTLAASAGPIVVPGADFLPHGLALLCTTAATGLDAHANDAGLCAACGTA